MFVRGFSTQTLTIFTMNKIYREEDVGTPSQIKFRKGKKHMKNKTKLIITNLKYLVMIAFFTKLKWF